MDSGERWLLDVVATFQIPVQWLLASNIEALLNRESHGLAASEVVNRLTNLLDAGHIAVSRPVEFGGEQLNLNGREVADALAEHSPETLYYGLTENGGDLWESIFHPSWELYVDATEGPEPERVEISSATRDLVEEYVGHIYQGSLSSKLAIPGSQCWHHLQPWHATYWKVLAAGWRLDFRASPPDTDRALTPSEQQKAEYHRTEAFLQRLRGWRDGSS